MAAVSKVLFFSNGDALAQSTIPKPETIFKSFTMPPSSMHFYVTCHKAMTNRPF